MGSGQCSATSLGCKLTNKTLFLKIHRCCLSGHASYKIILKRLSKNELTEAVVVLCIKNADLLRLPSTQGGGLAAILSDFGLF